MTVKLKCAGEGHIAHVRAAGADTTLVEWWKEQRRRDKQLDECRYEDIVATPLVVGFRIKKYKGQRQVNDQVSLMRHPQSSIEEVVS